MHIIIIINLCLFVLIVLELEPLRCLNFKFKVLTFF
jgi:hypothetical protein